MITEHVNRLKSLWTEKTRERAIFFIGMAVAGFLGAAYGAVTVFIFLICFPVLVEMMQWIFIYRKGGTTHQEKQSMLWDIWVSWFSTIVGIAILFIFLPALRKIYYFVIAGALFIAIVVYLPIASKWLKGKLNK